MNDRAAYETRRRNLRAAMEIHKERGRRFTLQRRLDAIGEKAIAAELDQDWNTSIVANAETSRWRILAAEAKDSEPDLADVFHVTVADFFDACGVRTD